MFTLGMFYSPGLAQIVPGVNALIAKMFPMIVLQDKGPFPVPEDAFDKFNGVYDVHYLLDNCLKVPATANAALWIVDVWLGDCWRPLLFGAAEEKKAVATHACSRNVEETARIACHETGHLLGLPHCREQCVMQVSGSVEALRKKTGQLCPRCQEKTLCSDAKNAFTAAGLWVTRMPNT